MDDDDKKDAGYIDTTAVTLREAAPAIPVLAKDHPQIKGIVRALLKKTPDKYKKTRPGPSGSTLTYTPWAYVAERLTEIFGFYTFEQRGEIQRINLPSLAPRHDKDCTLKPVEEDGFPTCTASHKPRKREEILVEMRLILPPPVNTHIDCCGSSTYYPTNPDMTFGDVVQAAQSYALRRAAARIGIALDLYTDFDKNGDSNEVDSDIAEGKAAWKFTLTRHKLTEKAAVQLASQQLFGHTALNTLGDLVTGTKKPTAEAYAAVLLALEEAMKSAT